jgi:hypothetical protein
MGIRGSYLEGTRIVMDANRRGFLKALTATAVAMTVDPERLLWVPGAKTIFLPPVKPVSIVVIQEGGLFTPVTFLPGIVIQLKAIAGHWYIITDKAANGKIGLESIHAPGKLEISSSQMGRFERAGRAW